MWVELFAVVAGLALALVLADAAAAHGGHGMQMGGAGNGTGPTVAEQHPVGLLLAVFALVVSTIVFGAVLLRRHDRALRARRAAARAAR